MDPIEEFLWENRRVFRAAGAVADEALKPLRLDAAGRALLEFLAREEEPITLSELARKRAVSRQHIHQSLARLRNPDWVERLPDPADARSVRLRLSAEGKRFWAQVRAVDRQILQRLARRLNSDELARATATVRRVREALDAMR